MLLVLDNCEHVVEGAASLVDALLDSCPDLRILATSREAVGVAGEVRWTVPALSVPVPGSPRRWRIWKDTSLHGCSQLRHRQQLRPQ
jgi:predicted ATPase